MRATVLILAAATFLRAGTGHVVRLPTLFERNDGQAADDVRYIGRNAEGGVLLKAYQVVFLGSQGAIAMRFPGAGRRPRMDASEKTAGTSRYFIGRGGDLTTFEAPRYESVGYRNLYPGISLVLRGTPAELEYDFVVAPHANPGRIRLAFDGIERLEMTAGGDLVLHTPAGQLRHRRPTAFQETSGKRKPVEVGYRPVGKRQVAFVVGGYDASIPLVIDPAVAWTSATVQGTINALAVDSAGNVYLAGFALSGRGVCASYRVLGYAITTPCNDAFVTKLDPTGSRILYHTILGGVSEDEAAAIAVDSFGNAYVLGTTFSADFPVSSNAAQRQYAGPSPSVAGLPLSVGGDLFIAKLDPAGKLLYSTFLGGPDSEQAGRIRLDASGNAYVSGGTLSSRFPTTPGAYIGTLPLGGGVVAKLNPIGTQVAWATYVGGDGYFWTAVIDLDRAGATIYSAVGPTVTKLSKDGVYQGAFREPQEVGGELALDSQGNMWRVGWTRFGVALIGKARSDGSGLIFETRFGHGASGARAVAIDGMDRAVVAGEATEVPLTPDALLPTPPAAPGFLTVFNPDGTVVYASYAPASIRALALGGSGQVYTTDGRSVTRTDLGAPPLPSVGYLVNAATFGGKEQVAPGEIVSLFGSALGPRDGVGLQLDPNGRVATSLAGTRVLFNGIPAPLLYVSDRQVNTVVPFEMPAGKTALVEVEAGGRKSVPLSFGIGPVAPGIFVLADDPTGRQVAALNQDGTPNSPQNPALRGSVITLFATGGGVFDPPLADGQLGPVPPSLLVAPVRVSFAGILGEILFAGSAPGLVAGVIQINARVPASVPAGLNAVSVTLGIGPRGSQTDATLAVR